MTKRLAVVGAIVATCLAASSSGLAAPTPIAAGLAFQPHEVPVPDAIVAAHPAGQAGAMTAVTVRSPSPGSATINAGEAVGCWRAYFTGDNSGPWGSEQENINPYWCGNGSAMRGADAGWHWQSCSWLVSCGGENGPVTWYGCANGCGSLGQQIVGHFRVQVLANLGVDITVLYQLYPNGNYWSYTYHN
jgi:hypothetical protein